MAERDLAIQELRLRLKSSKEQVHRLELRGQMLRETLTKMARQIEMWTSTPSHRENIYFDDLLSKLTEDEVWTLQTLCDFRRATIGGLEDLLGFSDRTYVVYQLVPLENFGLVACAGNSWRATSTGRGVIRLRQSRIRQGLG